MNNIKINNKQYILLIILVLGIGIASRFVNIGAQTIYIDETWVVPTTNFHFEKKSIFPKLFTYPPYQQMSSAKQELIKKIYNLHPLFQIAALHATSDNHPPLFFFANYYWSKYFGYNVASIRIPAAIYSIITFFIILLILKRQKISNSRKVIILSLVVLSPIYLFYSNFARPYTLLMLLSLLSSYLSYQLILNDFNKKTIFYYIVTASLCLYTHYYGVLVVASQGIYMFIESLYGNKRNIIKSVIISFVLAIIFIPAAIIILYKHKLIASNPAEVSFDFFDLKAMNDLFLSFGYAYSRSTKFSHLNIFITILQLALFFKGILYLWQTRSDSASRFWLLFFVIPFLVIILLNTRIPLFTVRNCLILLIPYLAICGFGLASIKRNAFSLSVSTAIGVVGLSFLFYGLSYGNLNGAQAFANWKSTAEYIKSMDNTLPVYVFHQSYRDALYYYYPDAEKIRNYPDNLRRQGPADHEFILVIMKHEDITIEEKIDKSLPFMNKKDIFSVRLFTFIFIKLRELTFHLEKLGFSSMRQGFKRYTFF